MIGKNLMHYEITGSLGKGGMGEVYRATDSKLRREVAIKVLPTAFTEDPERLARFEREAQLLAQLQHAKIASIYGLEETEGQLALIMELVEGPTLEERLDEGPLDLSECISLSFQIALALEAAHEKGIIHRDLKPQNIKISTDGDVKVLDFGLAKAMDAVAGSDAAHDLELSPTLLNSPTLTQVQGTQLGTILGTAAYMAPEQARGSVVDKRADIWAFGVVLYEVLTGERLFAENSVVDTLSAVMRKKIDLEKLPASTPPRLRELTRRCLERDPKNRLRDIGDARIVLDELRAAPDEQGAAVSDPAARLGLWRPLVAGGLVVASLVIGLLLGRGTGSGPGDHETGAGAESGFSRFTRLTFESGLESSPSLSPDGEFVAYTAFDGRDRDIFLLRIGGQRSINLTGDSGVDEDRAAFSPDGRSIAFRSERDGGGIFVMGATGESVRRLTEFGDNPAWSPDGREIVFATEGESDPHARERTSELWVVPVGGGEPRRVLEGDAVEPAWSPSGARIAYWVLGGGGIRDVWTMAADGSDARRVTEAPSVDWSPAWDPDGQHLYFVSDRGGPSLPWRVALDRTSGLVLGEAQPIVLPTGWSGQLSFSADGQRLVYRTGEMTAEVTRLPFDARSGVLTGPAERLFQTAIPAVGLDVAPDGTIVFRTVAMQEDVYLVDGDGTGLRKLTDDVAKDRNPVWSPSGSEVAFYSNRGDNYEIWTVDRDGGRVRQRTVTPAGDSSFFPVWSPDGRSVVSQSFNGRVRVLELRDEAVAVETLEELPIDPGDGESVIVMSWSPNGEQLAGVRIGHNGQLLDGIVLYDLSSKATRFVSIPPPSQPSGSSYPTLSWLPDSRRGIIRWGDRLLLVDTETSALTVLLDGLNRDGGIARLSSDGRGIYMVDSREEGDLWLASRGP